MSAFAQEATSYQQPPKEIMDLKEERAKLKKEIRELKKNGK